MRFKIILKKASLFWRKWWRFSSTQQIKSPLQEAIESELARLRKENTPISY